MQSFKKSFELFVTKRLKGHNSWKALTQFNKEVTPKNSLLLYTVPESESYLVSLHPCPIPTPVYRKQGGPNDYENKIYRSILISSKKMRHFHSLKEDKTC